MSRRKQIKPMHIPNDEDVTPIENTLKSNSEENSDFKGFDCNRENNNNTMPHLSPEHISNNNNSPIDASNKHSILEDFSRLIPLDDDEDENRSTIEISRQSDSSLAQFVVSQKHKISRNSLGRSAVRGRGGRGKGRGRGRGRHGVEDSTTRSPTQVPTSRHRTANGEEHVMRCSVCNKPFKRQWSLQVHELIHHKSTDSLPENLMVTLTANHKRKLGLEGAEEELSVNNASNGKKKRCSVTKKLIKEELGSNEELEKKKMESNSSEADEQTNDNNSQSSDNSGALSVDVYMKNGQSILDHKPMFGGITLASGSSYSDLRHQVSLARRTCKFCGKVCFKPSDLQRHLMKHTGERPFSCGQCGRKFKAKRSLHYHQRASHGAVIELSPALEDKFAQTKKYQKMIRIQTDSEKPINNSNLKTNKNTKSWKKNAIINKSKSPTSDLSISDDELSSGLSDSGTDGSLNDSKRRLNGGLNVKNGFDERANVKAELDDDDDENHVPSSEKLNADVTALIPAVPTEPEDNLALDDENTSSNVLAFTSDRLDDEKPLTITRYKINLRSEEVIATRLEGINSVSGEKVFLYKCHMCGKVFSVMSKLQNHLTVHMKRNRKQFSCMMCGEVFKLRVQWLLHSRTHNNNNNNKSESFSVFANTQGKPNNCSVLISLPYQGSVDNSQELNTNGSEAPKQMVPTNIGNNGSTSGRESSSSPPPPMVNSNDQLVTRFNSSNGPNITIAPDTDVLYSYDFKSKFKQSYTCSYCGKYFDRPFSLQRHERMHTGVKPCYCKDCGRGFSEPRNLRHHIIRFHSDGSLQHLLRRNRCKTDGAAGNRGRGGNRVLNCGRNSLLKRNYQSLDEGENLEDDFSEIRATLDETVPLKSEVVGNGNSNENVTVVIPTEVNEDNCMANQPSPEEKDYWERISACRNGQEILRDPKRSLLGNRRKQRPQKLVSFAFEEDKSNFGSRENVDDNVKLVALNGQHKISNENGNKDEKKMKIVRDARWQTKMTVASLLAKERGLSPPITRTRAKGSSPSFFANYTLRLDKKEKSLKNMQSTDIQNNVEYACCYCNITFCSAIDLNDHMDIHQVQQKPHEEINAKIQGLVKPISLKNDSKISLGFI